jgi:hypothetical protein
MKSIIFWDITPCSPLKIIRRFGEHVSSIFRVEEYAKHEAEEQVRALLAICFHAGFLFDLFFDPEDGSDTFLQNVG